MSNILLVGGLGHTDLSGKVPRPGLLMLRSALKSAGHDCTIVNYSTSPADRMFPPSYVSRLSEIYERSIRPAVFNTKSAMNRLWSLPHLWFDLRQLKNISRELRGVEAGVFLEIGKELAKCVKEGNFDAVGFSLYLGSSTNGAITIANRLRSEFPSLPIIFGGPQTTSFSNTIYQETAAPTALVLGEGELAIVGIAGIIDSLKAGNLTDLSKVPNVVFRNQEGRIIATARKRLSFDAWIRQSGASYEESDFSGLMKYAFIETSRGCPFLCRFCPQPFLSGTNRYLKPAENIVEEMVQLNQKFGLTHFELVGSSTPPNQAEQIADHLIARGLGGKFSWVLFMRGRDSQAHNSDPASLMKKLKQSGASAIFFGVEAADNETLGKMGKKEKIEDIQRYMLASKAAKIATIGSFIYPYPGMPAGEANLILRFLDEVRPLSAPVQALGLYPGTYCSENAGEIGCEIVYPDATDQKLYLAGEKAKPSMQSPEVLKYLLRYPLILSLPMRFWSPLPYKIDGKSFKQYTKDVNALQKKIAGLGILTGFSHSHYLISQGLRMTPEELFERMFYCSLTGNPDETQRLINLFNQNV